MTNQPTCWRQQPHSCPCPSADVPGLASSLCVLHGYQNGQSHSDDIIYSPKSRCSFVQALKDHTRQFRQVRAPQVTQVTRATEVQGTRARPVHHIATSVPTTDIMAYEFRRTVLFQHQHGNHTVVCSQARAQHRCAGPNNGTPLVDASGKGPARVYQTNMFQLTTPCLSTPAGGLCHPSTTATKLSVHACDC
jgi:hypothetical protein